MSKLKTFYGVRTIDDLRHCSFKAYTETRELAVEELKKYYDWFNFYPLEPDDFHIVPMQMIVKEDNTSKKEFILYRVADRILLIVTKDQFDESGSMWLKFPMIVHGLVKVEGTSFKHSFASFMHISDDITIDEIDKFSVSAREIVFNKKL